MKQHRDFIIYVRGGEDINALVIASRIITTPATQTVPAFDTEHLTLLYLEPGTYSPTSTGEQVRNSIKIVYDVKPFVLGATYGWREVSPESIGLVAEAQGSGYTGRDENGVPSVVGLGDGTIQRDGTFVPESAAIEAAQGQEHTQATQEASNDLTPEQLAEAEAQLKKSEATGEV